MAYRFALESMEDRIVPAVFNVSSNTQLTAAIVAADGNSDSTNTILLAAGTYVVTNQVIRPAAGSTLTIASGGEWLPIIEGNGAGRVFQIGGNGASFNLVLQDLAIENGKAANSGVVGGPGALGGGLLIDGGAVALTSVSVRSNSAHGNSGGNGAAGTVNHLTGASGTNGGNAYGGGIYVAAGSLSLDNSQIENNVVSGGKGGAGGAGGNGTVGHFTAGNGGTGGAGGVAAGGGVYVASGQISINSTVIDSNTADGGSGGQGGSGGIPHTPLGGDSGAHGATGGSGGAGGNALGGGIYFVGGSLLEPTVESNMVRGGKGGGGGDGGPGANGGSGGNGGNGGNGGDGGVGGDGGSGEGGGIYQDAGNGTLYGGLLSTNQVIGGNGGVGLKGGKGGNGGNAADGGSAGNGGDAGTGGTGGKGGQAQGGGYFLVSGALTLVSGDIASNSAQGGKGETGGNGGSEGDYGANGDNLRHGGYNGDGGTGGSGGQVEGGGVYITAGTLTVDGGSISTNKIAGGSAGAGGDAGVGGFCGPAGAGGAGGSAQGGGVYLAAGSATFLSTQLNSNSAIGAEGAEGGLGLRGGTGGLAGGYGGAGGSGGAGGNAIGGAVFAGGTTLTIVSSTIDLDTVQGGTGGLGNNGGRGGNGGLGASGGEGGNGGSGGSGEGGGLYMNKGTVNLINDTLSGDQATGGNGSNAGNGGAGGSGGTSEGDGSNGGNGGIGGNGGNGGSALGGAIGVNPEYSISVDSITTNGSIQAGNGGTAGTGGLGGEAGTGGGPGKDGSTGGTGNAGVASGPGLSGSSGTYSAGTATHLVFSTLPASVVTGVTFQFPVYVLAEDSNGNIDPTYNGETISLSVSPNPNALVGSTSAQSAFGVTTFTGLVLNEGSGTPIAQEGSGDTLTATGPSVPAASSAAFDALGYSPAQIRTAYGINQLLLDGAGETIAIVTAYNDPNIEQDVDTFDEQFGLTETGPSLYTQYGPSSSFLTVVNQQGQTTGLPGTGVSSGNFDGAWQAQEALEVEWAHAIAPGATIDLVEADNPGDLYDAVAEAATLPGVSVVSMGFGSNVAASGTGTSFSTPGVTFLASAGNNGAPGAFPANSSNVVAVGGTDLSIGLNDVYAGETGWNESGGGINTAVAEPSYQDSVQSTGYRTTPDVAFDGDPSAGAVVANSFEGGAWSAVGGASLSTSCWAGLIALVNQGRAAVPAAPLNTSANPQQALQAIYSLPASDFNDIVSGNNGYSAGPGYDYVTGLGSPVASQLVPDLIGYGLTPTLTALSANAGPITGGNTITISGVKFDSSTAVMFGETEATSFTILSSTEIVAVAPA